MKLKSIILMLIIVSSVILYLACVKSPVESQDDPPEEDLISIFREDWTESSKPVGLDQSNPKGKLIWYNPYTMVATSDIWDRDVEPGETGTHTIWMEYTPSDTGNTSGSWAGIMQYVNIVLVANDTEQYLELRLKGDAGIIHIDMCHISEDINGNGLLDTEDQVDPISMMPNGLVDEGEDCGRDGLFDQEEPGYNEVTNPDPNGDNWWYNGYGIRCADCTDSPNDYRFINGTEGNAIDPNKYGLPDSEDIDRQGYLAQFNSYASYKIDLDNGDFRVVGSNYNGWKTYRIPLDDTLIADTIINFDDELFPIGSYLKTIRIWLESQNDEPFTIGIASADLIGFKEPGPKGFIPRWRTMRDYQYAYGRIFDLGRMFLNHDEPSEYDFSWGDTIISIQLYYNARIGANVDYVAPFADFYVDLDDTTNYAAENAKTHVKEIDPTLYMVHPTEHWIMFKYPNGGISDNLLGYFMIVKRANGTIDTIGSVIEEPYSLKLLKHNSPLQSFVSWGYEWRNVYSMPRYIDLDSLEINIYKGGPATENSGENLYHQDGIRYIELLGLDRFDRNGNETPDGLADIYRPYVYDRNLGLLIFPDRKPFATDRPFSDAPVLESQVPEIYNYPYGTTASTTASKYYIKINYVEYGYLK